MLASLANGDAGLALTRDVVPSRYEMAGTLLSLYVICHFRKIAEKKKIGRMNIKGERHCERRHMPSLSSSLKTYICGIKLGTGDEDAVAAAAAAAAAVIYGKNPISQPSQSS